MIGRPVSSDRNEYNKKYYATNKEAIALRAKKWREKNLEYDRARQRESYRKRHILKSWKDLEICRELPEARKPVLIATDSVEGGNVWIGFYQEGQWYLDSGEPIDVTHWMFLPRSPY